MTFFLVLMALITSATATNQELTIATQEMQKANYFTFVMLIKMASSDVLQTNITFLMPNDRTLSKTNMAETSVVDFLLHHSIPSPLLIDHLEHFPTGSMIPTSKPGFVFKVTNDGRRQFFLNNVRIISPNICTEVSSIRCHGIDGVVVSMTIPQPSMPPTSTCSNSTIPSGEAVAPSQPYPVVPVPTAPPPTVVEVSSSPKSSCSPQMGRARVDLAITFFMLAVVKVWLYV